MGMEVAGCRHMVSQTKRTNSRALDHARRREHGKTLRFPPPIQAQAGDEARAPEPSNHDDDMNGEWFAAGMVGQGSSEDEPHAPDSGDRQVIRTHSFELPHAPEYVASTARHRRLLAIVSIVVLGSLALIAIALVTRERHRPIGSGSTAPASSSQKSVDSPKPSTAGGQPGLPLPSPSVATAASIPIPPTAGDVQPPQPADGQRASADGQRASVGQQASAREFATPGQLSRAHRSRSPTSRSTQKPQLEPGIPLSEIYVNRQGDLVDARGEALHWKAGSARPDAVGTAQTGTETLRDAGH